MLMLLLLPPLATNPLLLTPLPQPPSLTPHEYFISCSCVRLSLTNFCWGRERRGGGEFHGFPHAAKENCRTDRHVSSEKVTNLLLFSKLSGKKECVFLFSVSSIIWPCSFLYFSFSPHAISRIYSPAFRFASAFNFKSGFAAAKKRQGFSPHEV